MINVEQTPTNHAPTLREYRAATNASGLELPSHFMRLDSLPNRLGHYRVASHDHRPEMALVMARAMFGFDEVLVVRKGLAAVRDVECCTSHNSVKARQPQSYVQILVTA